MFAAVMPQIVQFVEKRCANALLELIMSTKKSFKMSQRSTNQKNQVKTKHTFAGDFCMCKRSLQFKQTTQNESTEAETKHCDLQGRESVVRDPAHVSTAH